VTEIEESKDLTSLSLDELIGNLKVYEMIIKKDSENLVMKSVRLPVVKTKSTPWRDSGEEDDEKIQNEICLVAQAPNEVCFESSYFSDENSSIDDLALDDECNTPKNGS
ncbi:hypothetical protein Tco_0219358, partial [Tanacetum coccineum]